MGSSGDDACDPTMCDERHCAARIDRCSTHFGRGPSGNCPTLRVVRRGGDHLRGRSWIRFLRGAHFGGRRSARIVLPGDDALGPGLWYLCTVDPRAICACAGCLCVLHGEAHHALHGQGGSCARGASRMGRCVALRCASRAYMDGPGRTRISLRDDLCGAGPLVLRALVEHQGRPLAGCVRRRPHCRHLLRPLRCHARSSVRGEILLAPPWCCRADICRRVSDRRCHTALGVRRAPSAGTGLLDRKHGF